MSMAIRRASYTGDPGLFGDIWGGYQGSRPGIRGRWPAAAAPDRWTGVGPAQLPVADDAAQREAPLASRLERGVPRRQAVYFSWSQRKRRTRMRHCRLPPQQVRLLPQVRGVRPRGVAVRQESKAESRQRSRNIQSDITGHRGQTVRSESLSNLNPEEVLSAPPIGMERARDVVSERAISSLLSLGSAVTPPALDLRIMREAVAPEVRAPRPPPPTVTAVRPPGRPRVLSPEVRTTIVGSSVLLGTFQQLVGQGRLPAHIVEQIFMEE